ncbi:hypothetical protein EJC51_44805 [Streptomyces aquilus]|uniref:Uncharacterized protein n=1 Tax=Streptomyces aquilus TaxID=2548456 RepID=A0A3Q9C3E2_9ACTN|nr:hypothetical protein [Streptomyces aquilus]AZP22573.1 hypothetical protein EJC51_44805 [Streptomyces aquilus]
MPQSVRLAVVGVWAKALLGLAAGALLLSVVSGAVVFFEDLSLSASALGLLQGGGVSVLAGIVFALAVLRALRSAEAESWFDR